MSIWTKFREPIMFGTAAGAPMQAITGQGFIGDLLGTGNKNAVAEAGRNNLSRDMFFDMANRGIPYSPAYNAETMSLTPDVQKRLDALKMDTRGLDKFRQEALRRGTSPWANLMNKKQYQEEMGAIDRAKQEARSGRAQAESDLARTGGLTSGARERAGLASQRNMLNMSQDASRQGNLNRLQIGINDESNRIAQLGQLPGMENQLYQNQFAKEQAWAKARDQDIQRQIAEQNARNEFNMKNYQNQLQAGAAQQQAQATRDSGSKGLFK